MVALAVSREDIRRDVWERLEAVAEVRAIDARSPMELVREFSEFTPDVLVLETQADRRVTGELVAMLKKMSPSVLVVLYSPTPDDEDATAIEHGVYYYAAGTSAETLVEAVWAALRKKEKEVRS